MHGKHLSIRLKFSRIAWAKRIGQSSVPKRYGASSRKTGAMGWRAEKLWKELLFFSLRISNFGRSIASIFYFRIGTLYKALLFDRFVCNSLFRNKTSTQVLFNGGGFVKLFVIDGRKVFEFCCVRMNKFGYKDIYYDCQCFKFHKCWQ